jgi:hypothetical protein
MPKKRSISKLPVGNPFPSIMFGKNVPRITEHRIKNYESQKDFYKTPLIKKLKMHVKK